MLYQFLKMGETTAEWVVTNISVQDWGTWKYRIQMDHN